MKNIASQLRALQFVSHAGHNLVKGRTFAQDHEELGELYPQYESQYDETVEYMIGLGESVSPLDLTSEGLDTAKNEGESSDSEEVFAALLRMEIVLKMEISQYLDYEKRSDGVQNYLQGLAEKSDKRCYRLQQFLN